MEAPPDISVVVVCDYDAGSENGWIAIRKSLKSLAAQDFSGTAEFILCEAEEFRDQVPADLVEILPGLKIVLAPGESAYHLKNAGVAAASSEHIAMLDADCTPTPTWLSRIAQALRANPKIAVISGKTTYPGESLSARMNALLDRAFLDPGAPGPTRFLSDNNCGYRRSAYLAHPLPAHLGGFANVEQAQKLLADGHGLAFDPQIVAEHDFEGWSMEADIRRNRGHATVSMRLLDESLPYARLVRLGRISIAPVIAWKVLSSWRECFRCARAYGIRWYEQPVLLTTAVAVNILEAPGMLRAFAGRGRHQSHFR